MSNNKIPVLNEGMEKRGGLNRPPQKPKPVVRPMGQNPPPKKSQEK